MGNGPPFMRGGPLCFLTNVLSRVQALADDGAYSGITDSPAMRPATVSRSRTTW